MTPVLSAPAGSGGGLAWLDVLLVLLTTAALCALTLLVGQAVWTLTGVTRWADCYRSS